jgi:8-amino-7-oxononanoate synthase
VKEAAIKALERYGTTAGSRVLNGTLELHEQLEQRLADFKEAESALLFTGGYLANVAILTALLKKNDIVFLDERAHASIIDGCVFSGAKLVPFRHNSVEDLRHKVQRAEHRRSIIIIDGVYSIEGDLALLPQILELATEEAVPLMVDDAHGFGIMGQRGSGTAEHFGLNGRIDLDIGMLGGALGGVGAFVACKKYVADYLRHFSRGFLFTTTLPPSTTAALLEALEIMKLDKALRAKLWSNVEIVKEGLAGLGYKISATESAIVSIPIGNEQTTYDLVRMLEANGVFVNAFIRPAVKRGEAKIRLTITAAHSDSDIAQTLEAFEKIRPEFDARFSAS